MHLGNARTFLINYAHARRVGAEILLRVEDLDTPRVKPGADRGAIALLRWLGVDWDAGPVDQTSDLEPYAEALRGLHQQRAAYPCGLTRKEIEAALSAPHADEHETRYPGTSRGRLGESLPALGEPSDDNVRLLVPDEETAFVDVFAGERRLNVQQQVGDFLVATKSGYPSYQLAVVVDDARQGVTDVVRGDDLIPSTHRQLWLQRMLGLPTPGYWHVPLVIGEDGKRLAKRHGDTRLETYRQQGVMAERVIGLMGAWCGVVDEPTPLSLADFVAGFEWGTLSHEPVIMTQAHHDWLLG